MSITSTEKKRRFYLFCALGLGAMICLLLLSFILLSPKQEPTPSALKRQNPDAVQGGAGGQGSPEYNEKLGKHSDMQAQAALKSGDSYVPPPVGKQQLIKKKEDTPAPVQPQPAPVQPRPAPRRQKADNEMLKRMMDDLAALDTRLGAYTTGQGAIAWQYDFSRDKKVEKVAASSATDVQKIEAAETAQLDLKVGDMLYAVVDTGVNSDVPSAVMATVAGGKYRKTRLIGSFKRFDERLVLSFNRAILPSGESAQIEAYAVDPNTTEASVASSVDTHFFERWGGLIASAFLEGLGEAKRYSGAESTVYGGYYGNSDRMVWGDYSLEDQAWIAAGKVGEKASKQFEKGFDRPPTVYLEAGSPVGVLVMNVKEKRER